MSEYDCIHRIKNTIINKLKIKIYLFLMSTPHKPVVLKRVDLTNGSHILKQHEEHNKGKISFISTASCVSKYNT